MDFDRVRVSLWIQHDGLLGRIQVLNLQLHYVTSRNSCCNQLLGAIDKVAHLDESNVEREHFDHIKVLIENDESEELGARKVKIVLLAVANAAYLLIRQVQFLKHGLVYTILVPRLHCHLSLGEL
jgi:hypothetical protein